MLNPSDPRWLKAVQNDGDLGKAQLATRLLISRLRQEVRKNPASAKEKARELFEFMSKNAFAQPDLAHL